MSISASQIVRVNPRVIPAGVSDLELNGLIVTRSEFMPTGQAIMFNTPESVSEFFGATSTESTMAAVYFQGYANSYIKPSTLYFYRDEANAPLAPFLKGGVLPIGALTELKKITAGELSVMIGAQTAALSNLDFSAASSFSAVAEIIQTALQAVTVAARSTNPFTAATVVYSSVTGGFIITGGITGEVQTIEYASGSSAAPLCLTLETGASFSNGSDQITISESMENLLALTQNFGSFTLAWMGVEQEIISYASWNASKPVQFLFVYSDKDANLLIPDSTETIIYQLEELKIEGAACEYGGVEYSAFALSVGACIDFNRTQGAITTAFKSQPGLAANVNTTKDFERLKSIKVNMYGDFATRTQKEFFHYPGVILGKYGFIDAYLNAIWLNSAIQNAIINGFINAGRVPYNNKGYALIRSWLQDPINRALNAGAIDTGAQLSQAQQDQINFEAGENVSGNILQTGYYIQIIANSAEIRVERDSPTVNVWYFYGGSVQKVVIASTALL